MTQTWFATRSFAPRPLSMRSGSMRLATMQLVKLAAGLMAVMMTVAGCSSGSSDSAQQAIMDRTFLSESVVHDGQPHSLVEGTQVSLRFGPEQLVGKAGCNTIDSDYSIVDGLLVASELFATEMDCGPELNELEGLVAVLLSSSPMIEIDGDTLTLSSDSTTIVFTDS